MAEIIAETTLPCPSTVRAAEKLTRITGGTQVGGNLFHSLQKFSVPADSPVVIEADPTVQYVFLRVTGSEPSPIEAEIALRQPDGQISPASLFLINSNGISFGPNASLALGGSLIATTAASITFEDGFQFGPEPSEVAELSGSSPVALQFGEKLSNIVVQSFQPVQDDSGKPARDASGQPIYGLSVADKQTLALIGGDIALNAAAPDLAAGLLTASAGRIEVGSVVSADWVSLTPVKTGWALGYEKVQKFGNIQLADGAGINSSGGGAIQLQGREITLTGESQIFSFTSEGQLGQPLQVTASDSLTISGGLSSIRTEADGPNPAGQVEISTRRLAILEGGRLGSLTIAEGSGGDVRIRADAVTVSGVAIIGKQRVPSLLYVLSLGPGAPGSLIIESATAPEVSEGGEIITADHPRNF